MAGLYDVTDAFDGILESIVIRSYPAGTVIDGRWTEATPTTAATQAVVHPASPHEITALDLPGYTGREVIKFYTVQPLRTVRNESGASSDEVAYNGKVYRLLRVDNWQVIGGFSVGYGELMSTTVVTVVAAMSLAFNAAINSAYIGLI